MKLSPSETLRICDEYKTIMNLPLEERKNYEWDEAWQPVRLYEIEQACREVLPEYVQFVLDALPYLRILLDTQDESVNPSPLTPKGIADVKELIGRIDP